MEREGVKRKRSEESEEPIIASITALKKRTLLNTTNPTPEEVPPKGLIRRDTVHRRVSLSSDQSVLDLEDNLFSPSPKLDSKRRRSLQGRHSLTDSDSSYSLIQENQFADDLEEDTPNVDQDVDSFLEEVRTNEELIDSEIVTIETPQSEPTDDDEIDDDLYSIIIIKTLPPYKTLDPSIKKVNLLPDKSKTAPFYTLILDLDETLVHSVMEPIDNYDEILHIGDECGKETVYVSFRPFLKEFLEEASKMFEIVVFTASRQCYADSLLDSIDPKKRISYSLNDSLSRYRLYREHCLCIDDNYIKDLESLNRDLKSTVILDNSVYAFGYHLDNGIPIKSWFNDKSDTELRDVIPFLTRLMGKRDVRRVLRSKFMLKSIINRIQLF